MKDTDHSFENDQVEGWTPNRFAITFTRKMRKQKGIAFVPSIRSSLAIPKFLTARYFRTKILISKDYIEAAVLNTAYEDQAIAERVANEILFPKNAVERKKKKKKAEEETQLTNEQALVEVDPLTSILEGLAGLQVDFESLDDLTDFDEMLEQEDDEDIFELFEKLYSSAHTQERSLAELMMQFGGPAEYHAWGAKDSEGIEKVTLELFKGQIGELNAQQAYHGSCSFMAKQFCQEAIQPWELASALAGDETTRNEHLKQHLDDLLENSSAREIGKTIQFLQPHLKTVKDFYDAFTEQAFEQVESLTGFSELVSGVGEWIAPSPELIQHSAQDIHRSLSAATWLNQQFGEDVSAQLFAEWVKLSPLHTLEELADVPVDCQQWKTLARQAYKEYIGSMRQALSKPQTQTDFEPDSPHGVDPILTETANLAHKLFLTGIKQGKKLAQDLMVEALCSVCDANHFLPLLDQFLGHGILPSNIKPVVQAAISLGINPDEVYDRIGNAVEQLRQMILNNLREVSRYQHLIKKINHIGSDVMVELVLQCLDETNFEGMAALLAIDMGEAVTLLMSSANDSGSAEGFISNSIAYKGIGGGSNLLKQWFNSRGKLNAALKAQIKVIAKDALIDVALEWINKGSGSSEGGLIPQNQARPYLSGDDLDLLDIENTLDAIINSGKSLDAITEEDLYVHDTSKGRAAFGVLLDISGSMSGDDLAMCAIAIVMLLGKVKSEEIALAVFESDTHVIKPFSDARDLDHVADQVLDIEATGGTCVDAALRWVSDEFEGVPEADFKILFLLTDFGFFEERKEVSPLLDELSGNGVDYLGAAHGYITKEYNELFLEKLGGQSIKIKNMKELPGVLIEALEQIKDSA